MGKNDDPWKLYKYKLDLTIDVNGEMMEIQSMQQNRFFIEKNFDECCLPVVILDMMLPLDWYHKIKDNKFKTNFIFKLYRLEQKDGGALGNKSLCFAQKFIAILDDNKPFSEKKSYETIKYGSGFTKGDITPVDLRTNYTFALFKEDDLKSTKVIVNDVMESCDLMTAVTYCLNKAGVKKVLMSRFDNTSRYNELLLLPIPLIDQLKYLNTYYGFYKNGAQIFLDFERLYILNNTAKCTAFRRDEITSVTIDTHVASDGKDLASGSYVDDEGKMIHIKISSSELNMVDSATSMDSITGNNNIYINTATGQTDEIKGATNQFGEGTYNIKMSSLPNPYIKSESELRIKERSGTFTITTSNIDFMLLTPNKEYKFASKVTHITPNLKGKFRLVRLNTHFNRTGDTFDAIVSFELRRTDNG